VFRIAQEAISNALRHSRAQHVLVSLRRTGGELILSIDDDGVGFDAMDRPAGVPTTGRGLGLGDLRERAERCGCELDIVSRVGGGTHVEVRCPESVQIPSVPQEEPA
jgi:signal transduction histidine kinase